MAAMFRRGKVSSIDRSEDTCSLEILDAMGAGTGETYEDVPIFYHCYPDAAVRPNGALESGSAAFEEDDIVIVKFHYTAPKVVGHITGPKACLIEKAVFRNGTAIYFTDIEGDPQAGGYDFTNKTLVGFSADDAFVLPGGRYWRCLGGSVYTGMISAGGVVSGEVSCTGFGGYSVRALNIWITDDIYYMAFRDDGDPGDASVLSSIKQCQSSDMFAWSNFSTVRDEDWCDHGALVQEGYIPANEIITVGVVGYFSIGNTFVLEDVDISTPNGAMVLRMLRIGKKDFWDSSDSAWSMLGAISGDTFQFYFEADFTIAGGITSMNILQII